MSLINDALKRAKQAQDRHPALPPSGPPLQPAVQLSSPPSAIPWIAGALAVLLLSCWFLFLSWRGYHRHPQAQIGDRERTASPAGTPKTAQALARSPGANLPSSPTVPLTNFTVPLAVPPASGSPPLTGTNLASAGGAVERRSGVSANLVVEPKTNQVPVEPALPEPAPSSLKLQGIFYGASRASALINGQTLFLGDEIDGAKVLSIERHAVRLFLGGKTNVLKLR